MQHGGAGNMPNMSAIHGTPMYADPSAQSYMSESMMHAGSGIINEPLYLQQQQQQQSVALPMQYAYDQRQLGAAEQAMVCSTATNRTGTATTVVCEAAEIFAPEYKRPTHMDFSAIIPLSLLFELTSYPNPSPDQPASAEHPHDPSVPVGAPIARLDISFKEIASMCAMAMERMFPGEEGLAACNGKLKNTGLFRLAHMSLKNVNSTAAGQLAMRFETQPFLNQTYYTKTARDASGNVSKSVQTIAVSIPPGNSTEIELSEFDSWLNSAPHKLSLLNVLGGFYTPDEFFDAFTRQPRSHNITYYGQTDPLNPNQPVIVLSNSPLVSAFPVALGPETCKKIRNDSAQRHDDGLYVSPTDFERIKHWFMRNVWCEVCCHHIHEGIRMNFVPLSVLKSSTGAHASAFTISGELSLKFRMAIEKKEGRGVIFGPYENVRIEDAAGQEIGKRWMKTVAPLS